MTTNFEFKKPYIKPLPKGLKLKELDVMIATWFGSGLIRPAPGTFGTLAALPAGYLFQLIGGIPLLLIATFLTFFIGKKAAALYEERTGEHDASSIVIDEAVGLWIAGIAAGTNPILWFCAFLLFRLFDIVKPWPASRYDKRGSGAYDVMMDDVIAGIFAFFGVATLANIYLY